MLISLLFILILLSALLSMSETSLFSLSQMKVRSYSKSKDVRQKLIARLLKSPLDLLVTILMLNIITNILVQNVVSSLFGSYSGWLATVGVPLALTLFFGEVIPKSLALANNTKIAQRVAPAIHFAMRVLSPLRRALTAITKVVSSTVFFFLRKEADISIPELKVALRASREYGILSPDEAKLIQGYLSLQEDSVKEHIRPRQEILSYDIDDPIQELQDLFCKEEVSRVPVYQGSMEQLLGIIESQDFFLHAPRIEKGKDLMRYLKKPFYIPESIQTHLLLRQMYEQEQYLGIAIDEYGGIAGLISIEDLVEIVIGHIADRRDEKALFTRATQDVIIASGKTELAELDEIFDTEFRSEANMVTLGGWLTEQMGDIPKSGDKYVTDDFLFHVLAAAPNRVRRVYIRKLKPKKKKK